MLLDIKMPGMNGLKVLEKARAIDRRVEIIIVNALHDGSLVKRAMSLAAKDCITKPIDLKNLRKSMLADA